MTKLQTLGVIQDAEPYIAIVRFRNLIVHEYEEIDARLLFTLATTRIAATSRLRIWIQTD
jgi:uncharacterized protein YutE (UPF0331/DUF86 family)